MNVTVTPREISLGFDEIRLHLSPDGLYLVTTFCLQGDPIIDHKTPLGFFQKSILNYASIRDLQGEIKGQFLSA
ncbi:MAG: hypothetical protein ACTHKB_00790 [Burkholderiaceae bacterium]